MPKVSPGRSYPTRVPRNTNRRTWTRRVDGKSTIIRPHQQVFFKADAQLVETLKLHAMIRRVSLSCLLVDLLTLWAHVSTDTREALWKEMFPEGSTLEDIPNRYPGYLASLGFAPAVRVEHEGANPQ